MLRRINFNIRYYFHPPWDSGISPPELLEFIEHHPAGRAIDLGCGTGTNVITLAQRGWQVTGIDFAPRAIQIARHKLRRAQVVANLIVGDVTNLQSLSSTFDLALDLGCFHGVENRENYLKELSRILTPGGHWLMYSIFRSASKASGPGLVASDLDLITSHKFHLVSRTDGVDRRARPSAWFLYLRPESVEIG